MRTPTRLAAAAALLALAGCGSDAKPKTFPVKGVLTHKGKQGEQPAAGALVVFHPVGIQVHEANRPMATVRSDGTFALSTFGREDGAPAGEYYVTVVWN